MNSLQFVTHVFHKNRDRVFLYDTLAQREFTYGQLYNSALVVADEFRGRGLLPGDRIGFVLCNSAEFVVLYLACMFGGFVTVPINPALTKDDVAFILKNSRAKITFVSAAAAECIDHGAIDKSVTSIIYLIEKHSQSETVTSLGEAFDPFALPTRTSLPPFEDVSADDTMTIVYTSGTTSRPNGVVHRYSDMIENARSFNQRVGIGPTNRFYNLLAMSYLGGYYNLLMLPLVGESQVVLGATFNAASAVDFWRPIIQYQVNTLWLVPTILSILLELDRGTEGETYCQKSVSLVLTGTAPLPIELRRRFEKRYGKPIFENYGLSETFFITTNSANQLVIDGSVGTPLPGVQVSVRSVNGDPLPHGEEGEIYVCTPYLMEGYFDTTTGEPNALARESWFPTGDIGVHSPTGEVSITGRKKDLIIRGGVNLSPAKIEEAAYKEPRVAECAAVGIPHKIKGEDVVLVIRLTEGAQFEETREAVENLCSQHLSEISRPSRIFHLEEFPKSSTGKIQKRKIRELLIEKLNLQGLLEKNSPRPTTSTKPQISIPGRIRKNINRVNPEILSELSRYSVSIISDSMNRFGVMSTAIRPLTPSASFVGSAITVEEIEGGNLMSHAALDLVQPGDVLVIDAKATCQRSSWGGMQMKMAKNRGVSAVIINGQVRDLEEMINLQIPIFGLGVCAAGPHKGWSGNVNYPVACGGVVVNPGDLLVGDLDGVVVVPPQIVDRLLKCCENRTQMEMEWEKRIAAGESTLDVVDLRKRLTEMEVIFE